MKAKVIRSLCLVTLTLLAPFEAQTQVPAQNRFDLLAKALSPFIALATENGSGENHALNLQASILETSGLPPELKGARLHVSVEAPDKLLAQIPTPNCAITIARHNDQVWASPAKQLRPLIDQRGHKGAKKKKRTNPDDGFHLTPAEAVLLPALLNVRDAGIVTVGESDFRVLDVKLMPELKLSDWSARVWIRPENESIAQIALRAPSWSTTLLIEKADFSVSLPPETWEPTPDQSADMVEVPLNALLPLLERLWRVAPPPPAPSP